MTIEAGTPKHWRAQRLNDLAGHSLKAAFYNSQANLTLASATTYTTSGELTDDGYTPGGYEITATVNSDGDIPFLDFSDLAVNGLSATDWAAVVIYDTDDANRIVLILPLAIPRTFSGRNVNIIFPTPNENTAILKFMG